MATFWHQMPFVRIILPLVLGIVAAPYFLPNLQNTLILIALTSFCYFIFLVTNKKIMNQYIQGIFLSAILFFCGALCLNLKTNSQSQNLFTKLDGTFLVVQLNQNPIQNTLGLKAEAIVLASIDSNGRQTSCEGKIMLYIKVDSLHKTPCYGDQLLIKSGFQEISSPKNPNTFNYKAYMARRGIFYQQFLNSNRWILIHNNKGSPILAWAFGLQEKIQVVLKQYLHKPEDIGISEALLYGYDKDIEDEIIDAFSKTGTLHVLAVSGMHVGMIFMLLSLLLKPLEKIKKAKSLIGILQLLGIWAYSVLCGLSPSILRATLMFSFVIIGQLIRRTGNPINSLAASAVALIWFDPEIIYNVGFQLSYAAVLGILVFYQDLYLLLTFKYKLADEIWKISSVSLAAQILTMPLSIFYFHQIPSYFLPANLLIIPLTSLLIYLGIALLVISPVSTLSMYLGKLISALISLTNLIAKEIANMPGAYIDSIVWEPIHIVCFYLLFISLGIFFIQRDVLQLKICLLLLIGLQGIHFYAQFKQAKQKQLCVYYLKKGIAIEYLNQNTAHFWVSKNCQINTKTFKNAVYPNVLAQGIKEQTVHELDSVNEAYYFQKSQLLFIWQSSKIPVSLSIHTLIVSGAYYQNLETMLNQNQVKKVLLAANLSSKKRNHLKKILKKFNIPSYDIEENGAYEVSL
ncbi:MAG: hypothetical protein CFE21_00775 [Bacteroidetes bacterium B1(2017)]|nr:MAG: hypothetical protein CFE21_00775 [Bacteroidetes bacterium B1(2017)]